MRRSNGYMYNGKDRELHNRRRLRRRQYLQFQFEQWQHMLDGGGLHGDPSVQRRPSGVHGRGLWHLRAHRSLLYRHRYFVYGFCH